MIVNNFNTNHYELLQPLDINDLGGTWIRAAPLLSESSGREGPFFVEKPGGGFRVFTTYLFGTPNSYMYQDYDVNWGNPSGYVPCRRFPDVELENGSAVLVTGSRATAIATTDVSGGMAEQAPTSVAITGGSNSGAALSSTSQIKAKGYDNGTFQSSGFGWWNGNTFISGIAPFDNGEFLWKMPSSGLGIEFVYHANTALVASLGPLGEWKCQTLTVGDVNGATGTAIKRMRHGTTTLAAGIATVSDPYVTANSRIILTAQSLGTVTAPQALAVTGRSTGNSFTIASADHTDTSVIAWEMIEP